MPPSKKKRGNGTGTAFRRGKTWTAQVTRYMFVEGGKLKRRYHTKGGFETKKAAINYLEQLKGGEARKIPTLLSLYTNWEANSLPKLSADKQTAYKIARKRLEPIIGRRITDLTTADLQAAVNSASNSYYTARDMKTLLSHLYNAACADQFVPANLSRYIVLPELEEAEATPFSSEEVDKLWAAFAAGDLFVGYLLFMIYSGAMPAELLACRKDMIDFDACEIYGCGRKTAKRKETPIVFADVVKPALMELCASVEGDMLYPHHKTEFYREYHEATARVAVRDLPPYSCRHTTGTEAAKLKLPAPIIQQIMRHSKISTSQRYIHLGSKEAHDALNSMTNG